jgi:hypothetical protein
VLGVFKFLGLEKVNLGHLGLVLQQRVSLYCEYIFYKVSLLTPLNCPIG